MKKVILFGGAGIVGQILTGKLADTYKLVVMDKRPSPDPSVEYIQADILQFEELRHKVPADADVFVNLLGVSSAPNIVEPELMSTMVDVYVKCTYHIYLLASQLKIPRVVVAGSNHVTDSYEQNGFSLLQREITTADYPATRSTYGALKLAGESLGHVFNVNTGLSVICLRLGTMRLNESAALAATPRFSRTLVFQDDVAKLFQAAIETDLKYGVYYGVSDNPDKPWSIDNTIHDLGYQPQK
jgi:nucleoside-diphosphate-sugar epimerase